MDLATFLVFLQDTGVRLKSSDKKLMYERQCASCNTEKLSCDDFIDMVRKHNLIPNKKIFERKRDARIKKS